MAEPDYSGVSRYAWPDRQASSQNLDLQRVEALAAAQTHHFRDLIQIN